MDRWLLALVVFCLFAARALYCATGAGGYQACMQSGMPKVIGMALATAVLLVSIRAAPRGSVSGSSPKLSATLAA